MMNDLILAVTATQYGISDDQYSAVEELLDELHPTELHHGCCIGGDEQIVGIARDLFDDSIAIIGHPPLEKGKMSQAACDMSDRLMPAADYLSRNRNMVAIASTVLACPRGEKYEVRSGTWYTLKRACEAKRDRYLIYSGGRVIKGESIDLSIAKAIAV